MWKAIVVAALLSVAVAGCAPGVEAQQAQPVPAPELAGVNRWFNSPPLTLSAQKGKVVLVEFWTFACINCVHVVPHVQQWHERYKDQGLVVVGVHTPEFPEEYDAGNLQAAIRRLGIGYAVAQDNGYGTWNAYGNRYWPAMYLIDKQGRIVYRHFGEGDYGRTEARIRQLLAAP